MYTYVYMNIRVYMREVVGWDYNSESLGPQSLPEQTPSPLPYISARSPAGSR